MTTIEILKAARQLISKPENWCRGTAARRQDGLDCQSEDARAVSWCAIGACHRVGKWDNSFMPAISCLEAQNGRRALGDFNDTHEHHEVLNLFDRAIHSLECPAGWSHAETSEGGVA